VCRPCEAWVGLHADGRPLGSLAKADLRALRSRCHNLFDREWKEARRSRKRCYAELAAELGIPVERCHFGEFDVEMCRRALNYLGGWP
jgi:hypothetical protein